MSRKEQDIDKEKKVAGEKRTYQQVSQDGEMEDLNAMLPKVMRNFETAKINL